MVTDTDIPEDGNITIDVTMLGYSYVANGTITDANVEVSDNAVDATWTRQVEYDGSLFTLNLTSTGGPTHAGEEVTVTFTGAAGGNSAWYCDTGDAEIDMTATRSDTLETSDTIIILIYVTPGSGGLTAAPGTTITTTDGASSMVLTVTGEPILKNDLIKIDVNELYEYVEGDIFTDANAEVSDDAADATWTDYMDEFGFLTLTSNDGVTAVDENIIVTFTGAGGVPWKAGSSGTKPLQPFRPDSNAGADYDFTIDIPPPAGYDIAADFSGSPTTEMVPLTVAFTDTSAGNPDTWSWDFGDGGTSTEQDPTYVYTVPGTYAVSLTASNAYSTDTATKDQYINALNGGVTQANTAIDGLTITNCGGGGQTVTVDTSVVPADLIPDKYTLEIQPPADRGLKNITIYAQNGIGFSRNGDLITGIPTRVHLESADIAPPGGFSGTIGTAASFSYSMDLRSYPCNAILTTTIREGILPGDNEKLQWIASNQTPVAVSIGTAYTVTITKTNFRYTAPVKVRMSVDSAWNAGLSEGPGTIFIWRVADNGNSGQIFPTTLLSTDPVNNLDFYEATSPLGMSTFGLSSLHGNNNPFQLITLAATSFIAPENPADIGVAQQADAESPRTATPSPSPTGTATPAPTLVQNLIPPSETLTAKIYTNQDGLVTQETTIASKDGYMTVTVPKGVVARGSDEKPLLSISLTPVEKDSLPGQIPAGAVAFAGRAFELKPDGATFSPGISLSFVAPADAQFGQDFTVKMYDQAAGTWQDIPTVYDARTGLVTAQVSRFCCFALFAKTVTAEQPTGSLPVQPLPASRPASSSPAPTAMSIFLGFVKWFVSLVMESPLIAAGIVALIIAVVYYERQQRHRW